MQALYLDRRLELRAHHPRPRPAADEALVRVRRAGICNTDLELVKGYMEFRGIPGHEFVGVVEECSRPGWVGRRVVGEINCGCGRCPLCARGDSRHCPRRTVLGIQGRDGAFAEYLTLPVANLHPVPESVPDEVALFAEPVAAAFEILEQVPVGAGERVMVLGDGKLGLLIAQVLATTGCDLLAVGRHPAKLELLEVPTALVSEWDRLGDNSWDLVVEATGSPQGLEMALQAVRPRGRLVLKTTVAEAAPLNLAPLVIHEITLLGSRCGPFPPALAALAAGTVRVEPLIHGCYPLRDGLAAFEHAGRRGTLKVLLEM